MARIEAEGEGVVTAGDIICDADVEILNPDLKIATLDRDGRLSMELTIEKGRGYRPAEKNKRNGHVIGVIPVDSLFSPVLRVNYTIEDTRVGQITDYDRLTLEVWTDGSIAPEEAISLRQNTHQALGAFVKLTETISDEVTMVETEEEQKIKF